KTFDPNYNANSLSFSSTRKMNLPFFPLLPLIFDRPTRRAQTSILMLVAVGSASAADSSIRTLDLTTLTTSDTFSVERGFGFDLGSSSTDNGKPFFFSVTVPEGNYKVSVTFGDAHAASTNTVKAESRQLMLEHVETKSGEFITR